ncbi:MAG: hypothetical protein JWQ62_80 [Lacunisphaera sp.]|nr:hypothetical protein [Lacunisphaera sp.]
MRIGKIDVKRRVWIGLAFAIAVTLGWWAWTRAEKETVTVAAKSPQPFVRVIGAGGAGGNAVLREQTQLFDPQPLFFPTEWNYGQRPLPGSVRRQPGQVFGSFGANLVFGEQSLKAYGTEVTAAPERLADVVVQGNEAPFDGMGQVDVQRPALAPRDGFLEVRELKRGKTIVSQSLNGLKMPRLDFSPAEFLVVVGVAGIVGEPIVVSGSGGEDIDILLRSYLLKTLRLGERLSPGRYRVLVGP